MPVEEEEFSSVLFLENVASRLKMIEDTNEKPEQEGNIYIELIKICQRHQVEDTFLYEARALLEQISPNKSNSEFNSGKPQGGFPENVNYLVSQLLGLAKRTGNTEIKLAVYNHLIRLHGSRGNFANAQRVFGSMLASGVDATQVEYCTLMKAYTKGKCLKEVIEVFEQMREKFQDLDSNPYCILITAYLQHKKFSDAFDVIRLMKERGTPNLYAYTALIKACVESRDHGKVWEAYELMKKDGCQPDMIVYTLLISFSKKQDVKKALMLFNELLDRGMAPDFKCIHAFLSALVSNPDYYNTARELLKFFIGERGYKANLYTYSIMLHGAQMSRRLWDARQYFIEIFNLEISIEDKQVGFTTLLAAYSQAFPLEIVEHEFILSRETPPDLNFLLDPAPTSVHDCVAEAFKVHAYLEDNFQSELCPSVMLKIRNSFFLSLANYGYFAEAMDYYQKHFTDHLKPYLMVISTMLSTCSRFQKKEAFYDLLKQVDLLLAPISPKSTLTPQEKADYKYQYKLIPGSLVNLYQHIILGLHSFGDDKAALDYFELPCQDPDLNRSLNRNPRRNSYPAFFRDVRKSSDQDNINRLDHILITYKPRFC